MPNDTLVWGLLGLVAALALAGLFMAREITRLGSELHETREAAETARDEARRAHVRLDNEGRITSELAKQLGWSDSRAHTRVIPQPVFPPPGDDEP